MKLKYQTIATAPRIIAVRLAAFLASVRAWSLSLPIFNFGAFGFGLSQLLFVYIIIKCVRGGDEATAEVWDNPPGLEWTVPSPAPHHTFDEPPFIQ